MEEHHLQSMRDFIDTYAKAWEHQHVLLGKVSDLHLSFHLFGDDMAICVMTFGSNHISAVSYTEHVMIQQ